VVLKAMGIHWIGVTWSEQTPPLVNTFNIYRGTTPTLPAGATPCVTLIAGLYTMVGTTASMSFVDLDQTLNTSTTYYYVVSAVNAAGESTCSQPSNGVMPR
jgi:hypothetical protein